MIIQKDIFQPEKILVEDCIQNSAFAQNLLQKYPDVSIESVTDADEVIRRAQITENKNEWKGTLLLARQRGPFLRLCPGTQKHICCLYHNLDVAAGCDINCTYCILQGYLNNPLITIYCNMDDMFAELDSKLLHHPNMFYRIGTGELSDSLTFDHISETSIELVPYFADKTNAIIELKTKSVQIENLLGLQHNRRTVVSWSMNAHDIRENEESNAPDMNKRLEAAKEIQKAGYRLGFHFDPMICHDNWEEGYRETVNKIFNVIKPENIAWISLGALRYPPAFDDIIRENHPASPIVLGELLPGVDKKLRYFKPLRIDLFGKIYKWIKSYSNDVFVYLCMESDEVWRKSFGWSPGSSASLKKLLDDRVR